MTSNATQHQEINRKAPNPTEAAFAAVALVADDEPMVRNLLETCLGTHGFRVLTAENGHQAVEQYRRFGAEIDVVLLDVQMPGLSGPEALKALQEMNPDVVVCFMSGHTGSYTPEGLLEMGAKRFFSKPMPLHELTEALKELARRKAERGKAARIEA